MQRYKYNVSQSWYTFPVNWKNVWQPIPAA